MSGAVAVDWGTSNLRAYRLAADGGVLERRARADGILAVPPGGFEAVLLATIGDWLAAAPGLPVLLSGMIGSRQGWIEVPYVPCPAALGDLAAGMRWHETASGARIGFVPGLIDESASVPDVMRGEEVQVFGGLDAADGLVCLPGTHSKWVRVAARRIERFATHMTGEAFEILVRHSILGRLMPPSAPEAPDFDAFDRGVARAADAGGLLHHLFGTRTLGLVEALPPPSLSWYLSGLLIGHESAGALAGAQGAAPVTLVGAAPLTRLYARALAARGVATVIGPDTAAAIGLHRLAAILDTARP
jgi:2-dehydro-3-deoxygalactonokinase